MILWSDTAKAVPKRIYGNNLQLWLDAADASTIMSSGGAVSVWADKSGQGNNATQDTGTRQPTTGAATQNGKNVLGFDGGDVLILPSPILAIATSNNTIFAVANTSVNNTTQRIVLIRTASASEVVSLFYSSAGTTTIGYQANPTGGALTLTGVTKSSHNILRGRRSGTTRAITFNGNAETTDTSAANLVTPTAAYIGNNQANPAGGQPLTGQIAEIIIYNRSLSTAEIAIVEAYLAAKWGISITTPLNLNPLAWYDASDTPTGSVATWVDKSGNGNDATQGTGSAQPTCTANQLNGLNGLVFNGNDTLALPSALYSLPNGSNTAFFVSKRNTETGSVNRLITIAEGGSSRYRVAYQDTAGTIRFQSRSAVGGEVDSTGNTNTDFNIITTRRAGTTQAISVNNGSETTNTNGADESGCDSAFIGATGTGSSEFLTGAICEILIFDKSLSTAQITQVNTYLANKWGITIS